VAEPYPFTHRLRVRYNECDPQNVVFNANYLVYFDITLGELWREAFGSYETMVEGGADLMVVASSARYLAPARFDDELEIGVRVARFGTTSMTIELQIACRGTVVTEGELNYVFIDPATQHKRDVPDEIRRGLGPYLVAAQAP
jgi:acyl-CoA thioester hydrolase